MNGGSQNVFPGSSGILLEMQMFGPHSRPTESETLGVGPSQLSFNNLPGDSDAYSHLRSTALQSKSS